VGCASSRQITHLRGYLPIKEAKLAHHKTVDSVLRHYFTDEAYAAIKDIPTINGPAYSGYAAGTSVLSSIASFLTFNGVGRKVIIPTRLLGSWGVSGLIHEYAHHLDDMDRDGELEMIDHNEFLGAFLKLQMDTKYAWLAINADSKAGNPSWFYDTIVGVGYLSERIAYVADQMVSKGKGPDYMWKVFRKMFKRPKKKP